MAVLARESPQVLQPSREFAVFQEEADQASELPGVLWCGLELVLELKKSIDFAI